MNTYISTFFQIQFFTDFSDFYSPFATRHPICARHESD